MLGKLIVFAHTRGEAIAISVRAPNGTRVPGLTTNRAVLAVCLGHPVFRDGEALVPFLMKHVEDPQNLLLKNELPAQVA